MGLFGLFGKKDAQPAPGEKEQARSRSPAAPVAPVAPDTEQQRQRSHRASDTAKKIDAIESEMSSEFVPSHLLTGNTQPAAPDTQQHTLPDLANSTDMLLGADVRGMGLEVNASEAAPILEEAAILFANEQDEVAEQMLRMAVADPESGQDAWLMLFDLYQARARQTEFEHLSIDYARRFETSPPAWRKTLAPASGARPALPSVAFAGKLDAGIVKLVEKVLKIAEQHQALRLEFGRVTEVAPVGCGLLLRTLKKLQQHDVAVIGANELTARIRAILEVGRRDETEAPWLLLLEILRLQNREHEFEETSIDYCITFEVSPPPFVPPVHRAGAAPEEAAEPPSGNAFVMPAVVDGRTEPLLSAIAQHADLHDPLVLDCSRLDRVDFSAAGQLMMGLAPLARNGKTIEMHHVNRLVLVLFSMIGLNDIVRVLPRKQ